MKPCAADSPCPCGRLDGKSRPVRYGDCCGRYLDTKDDTNIAAPDAEHLMRSRYSAFVLEREAYLLATWHVSTRPLDVAFDAGVKWLGLEVRKHHAVDADHAEVKFVARQKPASGSAVRLQERSRFVREGGRWYYLDGDIR
jgi:SEC-C motif-containing protein